MDFETRAKALAEYLNVDVDELTEGYDETMIETSDGESYMVLTDDEADEATREDIENCIDEMGLESFTEEFQEWIVDNALDTDFFDDCLRDDTAFYMEEMEQEDDTEYENEMVAELVRGDYLSEDDFDEDGLVDRDAYEVAKDRYFDDQVDQDAYQWYVDNFGKEEVEKLVRTGDITLDIDKVVEACIDEDGRGHFLSSYDGEEIELSNDLFAYRID